MNRSEQLVLELAQFIGSDQHHYNPLYRWMNYTDGVRYFANKAGAFWLLDVIGTELHKLANAHDFLSITFSVYADGLAYITVTDGDNLELWKKWLDYTDCPVGTWKFFLTNNVLMLTSEY